MQPVTRRTALRAAAALPVALAVPVRRLRPPPCRRPRPTAGDRPPLFGAATWTLPNGLRVVLAESRRAPVVAQYLFYGAGGGEDPHGRSGVAHFLEHMMFKGSANVASGAFCRWWRGRAARTTPSPRATSPPTTRMSRPPACRWSCGWRPTASPPPCSPPTRGARARRGARGTPPAHRQQPPRPLRRGLRRRAVGPAALARPPIIGWEDEIRAITRDDMLDFFAARYAPGNAVLVVAGDVREAEFRAPGRGTLRRRARPPRRRARPRPAARRRRRAPPGPPRPARARGAGGAQLHGAQPDRRGCGACLGAGGAAHAAGQRPGHPAVPRAGRDRPRHLRRRLLRRRGGRGWGHSPSPPRRAAASSRSGWRRRWTRRWIALLQAGPTEAERARSLRQITAGALLALDGIGGAPRMLGERAGHRPAAGDWWSSGRAGCAP